jgi:CheY-like chemotaxis protein
MLTQPRSEHYPGRDARHRDATSCRPVAAASLKAQNEHDLHESPVLRPQATSMSDWHTRSEVQLASQQLRPTETFNRARRMREQVAGAAACNRELRIGRRTLAGGCCGGRTTPSWPAPRSSCGRRGKLLQPTAERRIVLAHRNERFLTTRVAQRLADKGVRVVAQTDNGADAIGLVVAEKPDLVLVEDTFTVVRGQEVVVELRRFSPDTPVTAHIAHGDRVGALLDAGATAVFTRQVPPVDVALSLLRLVPAG